MIQLDRPMSAYLRENVHYTFSGFNFTPTFLDLMLQVGVDRIMFSTDSPYASMAEAGAFLDKLPVSSADQARVAHGNAERLFGFRSVVRGACAVVCGAEVSSHTEARLIHRSGIVTHRWIWPRVRVLKPCLEAREARGVNSNRNEAIR